MKSIVLIIPYFGRLPDYFDVWKMSALNNPTVDFLFFTDIDEMKSEKNISVVHISFDEFRNKIQQKFDFPISLKTPYKLCDFKPAYGYILSEYIGDYDFWGHCDIDLIFGDIRRFITDDILEHHQKILEHGHLTIYRNDVETNTVFMRCPGYSDYDYKKAFTSQESIYFDEFLGTMLIFRKSNIPTYSNFGIFFQISPRTKGFQYKYKHQKNVIFQYENRSLYSVVRNCDQISKEEILYVHFQKRKIDCVDYINGDDFYLIPNKIVPMGVCLTEDLFVIHGEQIYKLKRKWQHLKEYFSRFLLGDYSSFLEYIKNRKAFHFDMINAKNIIKEYGTIHEGFSSAGKL